MIAENICAVNGEAAPASKMLQELEIIFHTRYSRCEVSTTSTGLNGVDFGVTISRFIGSKGEDWRKKNARTREDLNVQDALSAMGVATVIQQDIPQIQITPVPYGIIYDTPEQLAT